VSASAVLSAERCMEPSVGISERKQNFHKSGLVSQVEI
jgi:hypothetical protein